MIINHNCCVKLVPLVIFIYDARSHIHQIKMGLEELSWEGAECTDLAQDMDNDGLV